MTRIDMLRAIEARDPDGGETEPTDQMYEAHKRWAIQTFGADVWKQYYKGGWDHDPESIPI